MTVLQVQKVSSTSDCIDIQLYPEEVYRIADAGCSYRVDSQNESDRANSRGYTNLVLEILDLEIARPLAQIPGLPERVRSGKFDSETVLKVNEIFSQYPVFVQSISTGSPGAPLQDADTVEVAKRAANLLRAKIGNGALLLCADKPLMGALGVILFQTQHQSPQPLSKGAILSLLQDMREGSLCHAIKIRVDTLINEWGARVYARRDRAFASYERNQAELQRNQAELQQAQAKLQQLRARYEHDAALAKKLTPKVMQLFIEFYKEYRQELLERERITGSMFV